LSFTFTERQSFTNWIKDRLRTRVYSLLREVAHLSLSSPPRLKKTSSIFERDLISDSSHWRLTFLVFIFTEEGSFLTPWCHRNQIRYFLTRSGKRDAMASFQRRNPGRNGSQTIRHRHCLPGSSIPPVHIWARPPWAVPTQSYPGSQGVNSFTYWPQPVPFSQDTIRTPVTCSQYLLVWKQYG
jgi:hypothetical protein